MNDCTAYVVGQTSTCDFPTAGNSVQPKNGGYTAAGPGCESSLNHNEFDAFVSEVSADGTQLTHSTYSGGTGGDQGIAIAVDSSGNPFITGYTNGNAAGVENVSDLPTTTGQAFGGNGDAFVTKLNPTLSQILYSSSLEESATSMDMPSRA